MKVTFVLSEFPKYSETFIIDQIVGLLKRGVDVHILSISQGKNIEQAVVPDINLIERCTYVFKAKTLHRPSVIKLLIRFVSVMPHLWRTELLKHLPSLGHNHFSKNLSIAGALARLRTPLCADIVISHFGPLGVYAHCLRSLGLIEGKLVTVFHGADIANHALLERHRYDYKRLFAEGDLMLTVSKLWQDRLISLGCERNKIAIHRMGIDLGDIVFRYPVPYSKDRPLRLLSIARLVEKKGLYYLCEAVAEVRKKGVRVQLEIIGDGPLRSFLHDFICKQSLEDCIRLSGQKDRQYVRKALGMADLFVLPSVTASDGDMEGIPVSLMEAMAIGTPCLSTYHSGIPELIDDGASGILVNERDCQALVTKLTQVSEGKYDLEKLALNARQTIEQHFNQAILLDQLLAMLRRIADSEPSELEAGGTKQLLGNA